MLDTWAAAPGAVRVSAGLLAERTYRYLSSRAVYKTQPPPGRDETPTDRPGGTERRGHR